MATPSANLSRARPGLQSASASAPALFPSSQSSRLQFSQRFFPAPASPFLHPPPLNRIAGNNVPERLFPVQYPRSKLGAVVRAAEPDIARRRFSASYGCKHSFSSDPPSRFVIPLLFRASNFHEQNGLVQRGAVVVSL